jgi:leucyl-tRNA synthetase
LARSAQHFIDYDSPIPVDENELPLTLPEMENFEPGDDPAGCLARANEWR